MQKFILYPISLIYNLFAKLYHSLYDKKLRASFAFDIPIIGVGNLVAGGSGKTPFTEYLVKNLISRYKVGVLSRGYLRKTKGYLFGHESLTATELGDEPLQMMRKFKDLSVAVCENRAVGIPLLLMDSPDLDLIILDDAFQHRIVDVGLNILLTEFSNPFFKDYPLPYGRLREPISGAKRADILAVTKCPNHIKRPDFIKNTQKYLRPNVPTHFFQTISLPLKNINQETVNIQKMDSALLFCGIANPNTFRSMFADQISNIELLSFPDHHYYTTQDYKLITTKYKKLKGQNKYIITTEKDMVRIINDPLLEASDLRSILYLAIEFEEIEAFETGPLIQAVCNYVDNFKNQ